MKIFILVLFMSGLIIFSCGKKETDEKKPTVEKGKDSLTGKSMSPVMKAYQYVGRYISERDSTNFRELKADGTFDAKDMGVRDAGTYQIDSVVITFKYKSGLIASSKIIGDVILDTDGELWKKIKN